MIENERALEKLIKNCPGNQNDLFDMQEKYSELKGKLDIFKRSNEELLKNKDAIEVLSKDLEPKKEEYINLENEIKKIKIEILEIERENLAHKLREELNEGDICPVCGSVEHHKEKIKHVDIKDDTNLEKSIDLKEKLSIIVLNSIRDIEAKLSIAKEKIKESESIISDLGEDFNEEVVLNLQVKMNELKSKINDYNIKKEELENRIKNLREECNNLKLKHTQLETKINSNENTINELLEDKKKQEENLQKLKKN